VIQDNRYSAEALGKFLDYLTEKGLLKQATAMSRKTAAMRILSVLDDADRLDLRKIDIDDVFNRFQNRAGSGFKPDSLATYKTRFSAALSDFLKWVENPAEFRTSVAPRSKGDADEAGTKKARSNLIGVSRRSTQPEMDGFVFPIPIREGVVVKISNVPSDLSKEEASKIAAVIQALAVP
jgi:hypothetical protein